MTTEAPTDPLDALSRHRNNFIEMAGAFLTGTVEAYAPIEELIRSTSKAHETTISELNATHETEIQKLRLIATTATAAADEKARQSTVKALVAAEEAAANRMQQAVTAALADAERDSATSTAQAITIALRGAEDDFRARTAREVADALAAAEVDHNDRVAREVLQATEDADARHEAALQSLQAQHASQIEALRSDFAVQAAALRDRFLSESAAASQAAVTQARESLTSEFEQQMTAAATAHEAQTAALINKHNNRVSGVQTMLRVADSGRITAEGLLAEARATIQELGSRPVANDETVSAEIAPEVDALLFPAAQIAPDESLTAELEALRTALGAADGQIGSLQDQLTKSAGNVARLKQELQAAAGSPEAGNPTVSSMKIARAEAHAVVRLVADANPQIMLVEAADLVGAALSGSTEMAVPLPSPVMLGSAA